MTALVIDASSAVHHLCGDPAELARHARSYEQVIVPSIFDYEVANAALRLGRRSLISADRADRMIRALVDLPASRVPTHGPLLLAALALTDRLTLADAVYLALALDRGADLLTIDRALADVGEIVGIQVISG
ncbi:MAG TPA: type II toxin-antitoxin system VapC family toxin [Nakamurella sp.]|nr:type II toxin-antitoxin system VapC family toxin [Nakamurella sp.]